MSDKKLECKEKLKQTLVELTLEKDRVAQLEKIMNHDPDTGLLQRHMLVRRMNKLISKKNSHFAFGILRLDKNYQRIRHTRDRMKVLIYVTSERLKPIVGEAHLYQSDRSDEFLFIIEKYENQDAVEKIIDEMIIRVSESHNPPASDVSFGCNVGVALYPDHARTLDELEQNAEIALGIYEEKSWNGFLYSTEIGQTYHENQSLEYILRMCIINNFEGFHIAYQPIVNKKKEVKACEALLRWDAPQKGAVSPVRFIPLAEESGMITYLGKWVLYNALKQVKVWREEMGQDIEMSVNVSSVQMEQTDFLDTIETALRVLKIPGKALHLEVTESVVMANPEDIKRKLKALQDMGIEIMLDDFGTGYSSLSSLNQFPIDTLKIAKEFIDEIPHSNHGVEMVRSIMGIAETFGFRTLAEGIEQQDQFDCLIEEGCKYIQGYITSPPIDATEFEKLFFT